MQALDLYASIEEHLDFEEQIHSLYSKIGSIVLENELKEVIDIGCGQGEFCRLLEYNGVKTYGIDLSSKQIEIAKAKDLNVAVQDIADVKEKFESATAVFDVLNYLDSTTLKSFIQSTSQALKQNGIFIFDVNSLYGFTEVAQGTLTIDLDEKFIAIDANFEDEILYTDMTVFEKSDSCYKKTTGTIQQYYHSQERLKKFLKQSGFDKITIEKFHLHDDENHDKLIFICQKGEK